MSSEPPAENGGEPPSTATFRSLKEFRSAGRGFWADVAESDWNDWRWQLKNRITTLERLQRLMPALTALPKGCVFAPRCPLAEDRCRAEYPEYKQDAPGHWVACWRSDVVAGGAGG